MTASRGRELAVIAAILVLAAVLRLPGLEERGRWDADQGHDMLVLRALVTQGDVPLLGPRTSIGTFHHGAVYYYLLAPAAYLGNADPVIVTGEIALIGIAAVAAVWWLARMLGGPAAGLAAAALAAISPAGIDESTFIWNPNVIPLAAALALGGAVRAWQTGNPRWWLLAAAGATVTMQAHVLGIVLLPPLAVLFAADAWRRRGGRGSFGPPRLLAGPGTAGLLVVAAGYVPLVIHELTSDFSETRAIVDYVAGGAGGATGSDLGLASRIAMVALRSVAWPLAGLLTDRPVVSLAAILVGVALMGAAVVGTGRLLGTGDVGAGRADGRRLAWWLVGTLAWSALALAVFAPSLAVVTPGLPNDHYHAFLDPVVLVLVGAGLAVVARIGRDAAARGTGGSSSARMPGGPMVGRVTGPVVAAGLAAVLVIAAVLGWPPAVSDDGGWRTVDAAAARVIGDVAPGSAVDLVGIPPFKSADALRFPLERRGLNPANVDPVSGEGGRPGSATDGGAGAAGSPVTIVVCDPLFDEVVGAPCSGPAEAAWAADTLPGATLRDRFDAGSRRVISVYAGASP